MERRKVTDDIVVKRTFTNHPIGLTFEKDIGILLCVRYFIDSDGEYRHERLMEIDVPDFPLRGNSVRAWVKAGKEYIKNIVKEHFPNEKVVLWLDTDIEYPEFVSA